MSENIITAVIICLVALIMIVIGISQLKSKEPVGFYTGEKSPKAKELTDVVGWNRRHGMMWILYGVAMIFGFVVAGLAGSEVLALIILLTIVLGGILVMMAYHHYLKKKYYKKRDNFQ